eukprot:9053251-Pyramimonas_sp.AAC.1
MRVKEGPRAACKNANTPSPSGRTLARIMALISRNVPLLKRAGQFDPGPPIKSVLKYAVPRPSMPTGTNASAMP